MLEIVYSHCEQGNIWRHLKYYLCQDYIAANDNGIIKFILLKTYTVPNFSVSESVVTRYQQ